MQRGIQRGAWIRVDGVEAVKHLFMHVRYIYAKTTKSNELL